MVIKISKYFGQETKFDCSNRFDINRVQTLMGEAVQTQEIIKTCTKSSIFYDIGAAIGSVGLHAAHFCKQVIMLEPDSVHFEKLKINNALNGFSNTTILPYAVGEKDDSVILYTDNSTSGICPSIINSLGHKHHIQVKMITLDSLFAEYGVADILKIDVEGYEYQVLQNMAAKPQYIFLEIHPRHSGVENYVEIMSNLLKSKGYRLISSRNRNTELHTIWKIQ